MSGAPVEDPGGDPGEDPVDVLRRWEDAGAEWRVLGRHGRGVTVGLFTCTGGEEVSRLTSEDPALVDFLGDRTSSAD